MEPSVAGCQTTSRLKEDANDDSRTGPGANLAGTIDGEPAMRGRIKVLFLPEYCVTQAEQMIPASDVSNQIYLIFANHFSRNEPRVFAPLRDTLLTNGDHYMHLADLRSYLEADQRLIELYAKPDAWARKAILNVAGSEKFSSDRTIAEHAAGIWNVEPCPV
jgi:glucan phosphorylase